jgi:hypothetical protein
MHEKNDGLVIVENEREYFDIVPASQLTTAIVDNPIANHCGFSPAEGVAAWESLRGWVAGLPQPTATEMQDLCIAVSASPLSPGPCRIEPNCSPGSGQDCAVAISAVAPPVIFPDGVPGMDIRVPPR